MWRSSKTITSQEKPKVNQTCEMCGHPYATVTFCGEIQDADDTDLGDGFEFTCCGCGYVFYEAKSDFPDGLDYVNKLY